MIKDHMPASHTHDPRAIERCEALAQDQQEPMPANAFDRARLAAARQHAAQRMATADEAALEKARIAEREAVRTREAATLMENAFFGS
eukprot:5349807-Prymnesium_polylepis.1